MNSVPIRPTQKQRANRQTGVSLVELMVAMTIGVFLLGAVSIIYVSTSTSTRSGALESQMNEDASLALEMLQQQIRLAGYTDTDADGEAEGNRNFSGIALRGCDGGFEKDDVSDNAGTTGFNDLTCATDVAGSDALAIRYEASTLNSQTADGNPANCSHNGIDTWDASAEGGIAGTDIALADNRYYIGLDDVNDTPSNTDDDIPTLFCKGRTGAGFGNAAALIPNVEDMQIQYAITNTPAASAIIPNQVTAYVSASEEKDGVAILGDTRSNWSRVAAVRVCLLVRTASSVPRGDLDAEDLGRYVDCDGAEQTNTDGHVRRAYHTTVQMRNMRPAVPAAYVAGKDPWAYLRESESE